MNLKYNIIALLLFGTYFAFAGNNLPVNEKDSIKIKLLDTVYITATKIPTQLKLVNSATSIVTQSELQSQPRSIAVDEALKFVPGVRIDNQANGSRVHMSIRGQGILSERGLRGIRVMIDGIPVNDPTGFAPDLYDIDWHTVSRIEVLRGSSSSLYGGSSSAGVLNIITDNGGIAPLKGEVFSSFGSNGFFKLLGQVNGSTDNIDYRVSYSRIGGDGFRDHSAFWGNNFSEKINWKPSDKLNLQQVIYITDYLNQNAEGLSLEQVSENRKQANPDAIPFNEYQKTNRYTTGLTGKYKFSELSDIDFYGFMRWAKYKETSNKAAQYRNFVTPGAMIQYNLHLGSDNFKNHVSIGSDVQWQTIGEVKFKSLKDTLRIDALNEDNLEDTILLANQTIEQRGIGVYLIDNLVINHSVSITGSIRYDNISNELKDKLNAGYNLSGSKTFEKTTGKIGLAWLLTNELTIYGNYSLGFIPPATEELASNPAAFTGFNEDLKPATSACEEFGIRGTLFHKVVYDLCGFSMNTKDDFFRFKLYPARGNQEVFYGNAGDSKRYGLEAFVSYSPVNQLMIKSAYTYSHFQYSSPDSLNGIWLPNSPEHQISCDIEYKFFKHLSVGLTYEMQSKWFIYTDVVHKDLSQDGFSLFHARIAYNLKISGVESEISCYVKNLTDKKYIAFTEPDPDGNCYQPAARREIFGQISIRF